MVEQSNETRVAYLETAFRIEVLTIVLVIAEAILTIIAGIESHSTSLIAFGADSAIELTTAAAVLWRISVERKHNIGAKSTRAENIAAWITGFSLLALCIYIILGSFFALVNKHIPTES